MFVTMTMMVSLDVNEPFTWIIKCYKKLLKKLNGQTEPYSELMTNLFLDSYRWKIVCLRLRDWR